mgnify:FL=1
MKVLGLTVNWYLVKVRDDLYYHGNGEYGGFAPSADQIIRFDPYLEEPENPDMEVPEIVRKHINSLMLEKKK